LRAESNPWLSLLATGLVAVLFGHLRARLQRGVNRLLYGQRDEPYTVIARLSQRLKEQLSADLVLLTIVETVAQALRLPYVAIGWNQEEAFEPAASYGHKLGDPVSLPLVYQGETIGQLQLAPRAPGEAFTPADQRLLDELARQASLAAHAVRLSTDLQQARERLVLAREEERRRLRRELHDGVGPTLASLSQRIDTAAHLVSCDPEAAIVQLGALKAQIKSTIADLRRVAYTLRPPILDELGLMSALQEQVLQIQEVQGLRVTMEAPASFPELSAAVEVATYRIILEALTNVTRHAHAHHCLVCLGFPDERELSLSIVDDGCGLPDAYQAGVGITSMRERAAELGGECLIISQSGSGTRVQVRLPLK
jgi:signal transduction histidine kinase